MSNIKITCDTKDHLLQGELVHFQGSLKNLSTENLSRLKKSIIKYGFSFPVFVWQGHYEIIDGHQRLAAIMDLIGEGHTIENIPIVQIEAKDEKEAAEKVLMISQQYGKFDQAGLFDFTEKFEIDIDEMLEVAADDFDFDVPALKEYPEKEYDENLETENCCPKCGYEW